MALIVWGAALSPVVGQTAPGAAAADLSMSAQRVFDAKCVRCHGGARRRSDVDLLRHRGLDKNQRLVPGDPSASKLFQAITHGSTAAMPPKEPRISAEDIEVVRAWIEAGARRPASADSAPPFRPTPLKVEDPDRQYWAFRPLQRPQVERPRQARAFCLR